MVDTAKIGNTSDAPIVNNNFVAIGMDLGMGHASLVINSEEEDDYKEFEFIKKIYLDDAAENVYYKIVYTISPGEIPTFLAYCNNIRGKALELKNAFFFDGSTFIMDGALDSDSPVRGNMTCVGFCLAVLDGFTYPDYYICHDDWDSSSHDSDYLTNYCERRNLRKEDIEQFHKRITPLELFTASFIASPVSKDDIDIHIDQVESFFKKEQDKD